MMFLSIWNRTNPCVTAQGSASGLNALKSSFQHKGRKHQATVSKTEKPSCGNCQKQIISKTNAELQIWISKRITDQTARHCCRLTTTWQIEYKMCGT